MLRTLTDKGYDCQEEVLKRFLDVTLADIGLKNEHKEHLLTISYHLETITKQKRTSTKVEDIQACLHVGMLPACYENSNLRIEVPPQGEIEAFVRGENKSYVTCPMGQRLNKTRDKNGGIVYFLRIILNES